MDDRIVHHLWVRDKETTWPFPGKRFSEIAWTLRYGLPGEALDARLEAASIVDAFECLVWLDEPERSEVVKRLRRAAKMCPRAEPDQEGCRHG